MMKDSKEKISEKVQGTSSWLEEATIRQDSKDWVQKSFRIAILILREIRRQKDINSMTQKKLAEAMDVSPQYISKVVKGKENLTLETITKVEQVLGIKLIEIATKHSSLIIKKENLGIPSTH